MAYFDFQTEDAETFQRFLGDFVPEDPFDAHNHLYRVADLGERLFGTVADGPKTVDLATYRASTRQWMGAAAPTDGLFFPFPTPTVDFAAANDFVCHELAAAPGSRWLALIHPDGDPAAAESRLRQPGCAGFKVYHVYAAGGGETFLADTETFLPEWAWELADQQQKVIMLHMVKRRAAADPVNQRYIHEHCVRYPQARLILAHAARGFCGRHTVDGLQQLRGLHNLYFDTSAISDPEPFEAILRTYGVSRLMWANDFPISDLRGRCVTFADSFFWIYRDTADFTAQGGAAAGPTLIGIQSLMALQRACCNLGLNDDDRSRLFGANARQLLGITTPGDDRGQALYRAAKAIIPGGTMLLSKRPEMHAPDVWPPYYREAHGCEIIDLDGRHLIDFSNGSVGACILGYADPEVTAAVVRTATQGAWAALNPATEVELAELLLQCHPWAEMVRLGRLGGETMVIAARIARAATGRQKIAVCGYHGWHDWYLAANLAAGGDTIDQLGAGHLLPGLDPAGVPAALGGTVQTFVYNDLEALQQIVARHGDDLAAIVMEPTRSQQPQPGFLEGVRRLADESGARLIFDEITIGWRLACGGAHLRLGVEPDLAVFAKTLGNGHPIAAVIGKSSTMAAAQTSFISSAFWTEGMGPAAAVATVRKMLSIDVPAHVARIGQMIRDGLAAVAAAHQVPLSFSGYPAMTVFVFDHPQAAALQTLWTTRMLARGYLAAAGVVPTLAHQDWHVEQYLAASEPVFAELGEAARRNDAESRLDGPVKHTGFRRLA